MPIAGLVDERMRQEARLPGRLVRLGTVQKGKREGFGKDVKLYDLPYFRFTPDNGDERLTAAFAKAYGPEPTEFPDVRIPVDIAGNFDILNCSWLVASKHTERGDVFLARSDGVNIKQARQESNGRKVDFFLDGEMLHKDHTRPDNRGNPGFYYKGTSYAWQQVFAIDLIFPAFNRLVFKDNIVGYGAITLKTTSVNDIPTLTKEYDGIIEELAAAFINPMAQDAERVKRYLPLRNFPIRLWRQDETIGTPDYRKDADPSDRLLTSKSLLHWQVSPEFSASIQRAIDLRTAGLLEAAAKQSFLLPAPSVAQLNADLYSTAPQLPEPERVKEEYTGPDWENISNAVDGEFETETAEPEQPGNDPGPMDWKEQALSAKTLDAFAAAVYQEWKDWFSDAVQARKGVTAICGNWKDVEREAAWKAISKYVNSVADGAKKIDARDSAISFYALLVDEIRNGVPF